MSLDKEDSATFTLIKESASDYYGRNKSMNKGSYTGSGLGANYPAERHTRKRRANACSCALCKSFGNQRRKGS